MKNAQSEILGLAIVVLLLTFGLLLYLIFGISGNSSSLSVEYTFRQLPVVLNNALLEVHTTDSDCYGETIQELLLKAGEGNSLVCSNGQPVKEFVTHFLQTYLNETLGSWNMEYRYIVYTGTNYKDNSTYLFSPLTNAKNNCYGKDVTTENFFFRMSTGDFLNIKLDLCS